MNRNLFLFVTAISFVCSKCPEVRCRTVPSVSEGQPSQVSCFFIHDLRKNKTDFSIYRYSQDSHDRTPPKQVLECRYIEGIANPQCRTAKGYNFTGDFGTVVTVTIPSTNKEHAGKYLCQSSGQNLQIARLCPLHIKATDSDVNKTSLTRCTTKNPVIVGGSSFVKCEFPHDPKEGQQNFGVLRYDNKSGTDSLPEHVMDCTWHANKEKPICQIYPGYSFDYGVGKQLTLKIISASLTQAGKYACRITGASTNSSSCCTLDVHELSKDTLNATCATSNYAELGKSTSVTCTFPKLLFTDGVNIGINHYYSMEDGSINPLGRPVLSCSNGSRCQTAAGYSYVQDEKIPKLKIDIPALERHQLGQYVCMVKAGQLEAKLQNCSIALSQSSKDTGGNQMLGAIIGSAIGGALSTIVIILVIREIHHRRRNNRSSNSRAYGLTNTRPPTL